MESLGCQYGLSVQSRIDIARSRKSVPAQEKLAPKVCNTHQRFPSSKKLPVQTTSRKEEEGRKDGFLLRLWVETRGCNSVIGAAGLIQRPCKERASLPWGLPLTTACSSFSIPMMEGVERVQAGVAVSHGHYLAWSAYVSILCADRTMEDGGGLA